MHEKWKNRLWYKHPGIRTGIGKFMMRRVSMKARYKSIIAILVFLLLFMGFAPPALAHDEPEELTETVTDSIQKPDAIFTEFEVLEDNGYTINMYHSYQGPLCDAAFAYAQGNNMLVTDYFNVSVNNNLRIYEIASQVRLKVQIPIDLVQRKRTWWMFCISRKRR